jgi:hypothetical protein
MCVPRTSEPGGGRSAAARVLVMRPAHNWAGWRPVGAPGTARPVSMVRAAHNWAGWEPSRRESCPGRACRAQLGRVAAPSPRIVSWSCVPRTTLPAGIVAVAPARRTWSRSCTPCKRRRSAPPGPRICLRGRAARRAACHPPCMFGRRRPTRPLSRDLRAIRGVTPAGRVAPTTPEGGSQWGHHAMLDDDRPHPDSGGSASVRRAATRPPAATPPIAATPPRAAIESPCS